MKKSPPAGRVRGSRKPKPPGVVPITKYFSRSPKSTPSVTEAAGSSSDSTAQLSPPLKELPKPPLSDTSNQSMNGCSGSTKGEKMSMQPLKVSPKKIKLRDVSVVLRKSPIKREKKAGTCSEAGAENHQHKPQTESPQSNVITISDSPTELSSSLSIDVELSVPEPKRVCLIDLTESPLVMVNVQQRNNTQLLDKAVCNENSDKGGRDTNERVKEPVPTMSSTTPNTNCSIKKALFTDCEMQCTSTNPKDDLASVTSPSLSSQKNKVEDTSSSKEVTQTLTDLQAGEKAIQHTEDRISQPLNLPTNGEKFTGAVHPPTAGEKTFQTLNLPNNTGEMTAQPLNLTTTGEETLKREGGIQPLNLPTTGEKTAQTCKDAITGGETSQPVSPLVTEGDTSQHINPPTAGKNTPHSFNCPVTGGDISHLISLPVTGGEISQPVNPKGFIRSHNDPTGEGNIQHQTVNLSVALTETSGCTINPTQSYSSSAADSATVSN